MPINLAYHLRVGKDMPTNSDGHIVHPRYYPEHPAAAHDAWLERWRKWAAEHDERDWLPDLKTCLERHPRRTA